MRGQERAEATCVGRSGLGRADEGSFVQPTVWQNSGLHRVQTLALVVKRAREMVSGVFVWQAELIIAAHDWAPSSRGLHDRHSVVVLVVVALPAVLAAKDVGLRQVPGGRAEGAGRDGAVAGHKQDGGVVQLQQGSGREASTLGGARQSQGSWGGWWQWAGALPAASRW